MRTSRWNSGLFKRSKKHLFNLGKTLVLPNELGFIIKIADDKRVAEDISHYRARCIKDVHTLIKNNPAMVSILVTGAILGVKQNSVDATMKMVTETRKLLFSGRHITAEMEDNALLGTYFTLSPKR